MPFEFTRLSIEGLVLVAPRVFPDTRGFFLETFKESDFHAAGIDARFVQDNHSWSRRDVIRGLHFQRPPKEQGKLVMVTRGAVFDVAVDLRRGSPTFGRWEGRELSGENHNMLYIPPGFAHGFCVLTDEAHLTYKCTREYDADLDAGIRWDDPDIGIRWPVTNPVISEKDRDLPFLNEAGVR